MDTALQSRILQHVSKAENGCWIWTGANRLNYGAIKVAGKVIGAHVASYMAFKGPLVDGKDVMHSCDVRSCVNPDHLSLGTRSENARDAGSKNRIPGKAQGRTLTDDEIKTILDQYDHGQSKREIQKSFNLPPTTLTRLLIRHGREQPQSWTKVSGRKLAASKS